MNEHKRKAYYYACNAAVFNFAYNAENCENENECQKDFDYQRRYNVAARKTVRTESACFVFKSGKSKDTFEDRRACCRARKLRYDINKEFRYRHFARYQHGDRYSGVYVAARNVSYRIRHRNDYKTERKRSENISAAVYGVTSNRHCGSAADKNQNACAYKFRYRFFQFFHINSPFIILLRGVLPLRLS